MASKRTCKGLTISKKLEVLAAVDKNTKSKTEIAKEFCIPLSTLSTFIKNRNSIETAAVKGKEIGKRKRIRGAKHEDLESELFEWFCLARANNIPLSGPLLKERADEIALKQRIDFKCSNGWLQRFQFRHNIVSLCIRGEGSSVDIEAAEIWRESVIPILDAYSPKDTFNCDETGLFYNLQPERTLAVKGETCRGGKKCKERLTVLLACNADGSDKLRPLIIGKFEKPRCFKGVKHFPSVDYQWNKSAWMTSVLFMDWLIKLERRMACQDRKILLLMDQCAAHNHSSLNLNCVRVLYLPANTTSYMQPLDQGIINCLKSAYRKRLVRYYLREINRNIAAGDIRKWNVLDAMRNIAAAWDAVQQTVIANCFAKAGFTNEAEERIDEVDADDDASLDWNELQHELDECPRNFQDFVEVDSMLATSANTCSGNLDTSAPNVETATADLEAESEEAVDTEPEPVFPTRAEAFTALSIFEKILHFNVDEKVSQALDKMSAFVTEQYRTMPKQTTIDDYFKK